MKKVLIGMAAAAMAVAGTGAGTASAAPSPANTIFANILDRDATFLPLLLAADLDESINSCSGPVVTVFFPSSMAIVTAAATALGTTATALLADEATLKGLISLHVTTGYWSADTLNTGLFKSLPSAGVQPITITPYKDNNPPGAGAEDTPLSASGNPVVASASSCNGIVHFIGGVITPTAKPANPACGANFIGQCPTSTSGGGSGSGLPKTGSESMALTYAALASLIAGAGVLVIRRRSIA